MHKQKPRIVQLCHYSREDQPRAMEAWGGAGVDEGRHLGREPRMGTGYWELGREGAQGRELAWGKFWGLFQLQKKGSRRRRASYRPM